MAAKISIIIPIHQMKNGDFFLWRNIQSIMMQSFKDYEVIITQDGLMAENTNAAMRKAQGEIIKILYLDDYLAHRDSLQVIVDNMGDSMWLATGCLHDNGDGKLFNPHLPSYSQDIHKGNNTIGSPSVLVLRREGCLYFDTKLSFALDCDLYHRYYKAYGLPATINDLNVVIGLHDGQTTNLMSNQEKIEEFKYVTKKHE